MIQEGIKLASSPNSSQVSQFRKMLWKGKVKRCIEGEEEELERERETGVDRLDLGAERKRDREIEMKMKVGGKEKSQSRYFIV